MSGQELDSNHLISTRIQELEDQNRKLWKVLSIGFVIFGALVAVLIFLVVKPRHTVEAEAFVLKDSHGKRRAVLTTGLPFLMPNNEATRALMHEELAKTARQVEGASDREKQEGIEKLLSEMQKRYQETPDPQLVFYGAEDSPKLNVGLFGSAPHVILGGEQSEGSVEESSIRLEVEETLKEPVVAVEGHVARIGLRVNSVAPELTFTSKKNAVLFRRYNGKNDYLYQPSIKWMGEKGEGEWDDFLSQIEWPGIAR